MKSLFIAFEILFEGNGISKKIKAEHSAFLESGLDMELVCKRINNGIELCIGDALHLKLGNKIIARLTPWIKYDYLYEYIYQNDVRFIYIRYTQFADVFFIQFLKKVKSLGVVVYMEIPTYPYDGELKGTSILRKISGITERYYRAEFCKYIDKIITFSDDEKIFNIDTINISNAIDFNSIKLRENNPSHDYVKFIGVATLSFWHGYDRLILAISDYYTKNQNGPKVYFDVVGIGPSLNELQTLTSMLKLNEYIKFCGRCDGQDLDEILCDADICVGSLGCYRKDIIETKTLKNVEYAARGIPFIYSETNNDFDDKKYVFKVSNDDSIIDIKDILLNFDFKSFIPSEIRSSVCSLSWSSQINTVCKYLQMDMSKLK